MPVVSPRVGGGSSTPRRLGLARMPLEYWIPACAGMTTVQEDRDADMFDLAELERAHEIVGQAVPPTPAHAWPLLAERLGTRVVVKHENHTPTSAFKVRGGLIYLDRLKRERPNTPGIIWGRRGKHG